MWITLLVMGVAVSMEPFRIGMSVLMLNRPRPRLQLAALLGGGLLTGLSVGAVVLLAIEYRLPESARFTLPRVQVGVGVLTLLAAAVVAATSGRIRTRPPWLTRLLAGESLWVAGVAGMGMGLPSVDYLAALTVITAADVSPATRSAALLLFLAVAFAWVELPLLALLVAPQPTRAAMTAMHRWIRARPRRDAAVLLAVVGIVLVAAGLFAM
ncbi:MAG TPA: hypothetical protein DEP24_03640 [Mycobacterium sp.]|nr:hypothetical protein [Mycobacterium sp.]